MRRAQEKSGEVHTIPGCGFGNSGYLLDNAELIGGHFGRGSIETSGSENDEMSRGYAADYLKGLLLAVGDDQSFLGSGDLRVNSAPSSQKSVSPASTTKVSSS